MADEDPFQGRKDLQQQRPEPVDCPSAFMGQVRVETGEDFQRGEHSTVSVYRPQLDLLIKCAGPTGLRGAGRGNVLRWARNHSRKDPTKLIDEIFAALGEQTVTVIGTDAVGLVIPRVAAHIKELKHQRAIVAAEVEKLLDDAGDLLSARKRIRQLEDELANR